MSRSKVIELRDVKKSFRSGELLTMYKVELINGNIKLITPNELKRFKNIINAFLYRRDKIAPIHRGGWKRGRDSAPRVTDVVKRGL